MGLHTRLQRRKENGIYYCRVAIPKNIQHIIGKREFHISLKTSNPALARELVKVESLKIDQIIAEASGKSFTVSLPEPQKIFIKNTPQSLPDRAPTFKRVVDTYLSLPEKNHLSDKTKLEYKVTFRILGELLGNDSLITDITRADCRRVQEVFSILPPNSTKRFPNMNIMQIAERAKKQNIEPMAPKSANNYLSRLSSLFNWLMQEGIIVHNPAQGLLLPESEADKDKRHPFNEAQLKHIFNDKIMQSYKAENKPQFWIPILALWTGCRLNELCQLNVEDIDNKGNIYCLSITNGEGKRLKTANSQRIIPIHPYLVEIGFIKYVQDIKNQRYEKLFPELKINAKGRANDYFSKWFAGYLTALGIKSKKICFHSFRHTFRDALREAGISRELVQALGGWKDKSGGVEDVYGSGFGIQKLYEAICKITYSV